MKAFKTELTNDHEKQVAAMKEVIDMKEQERERMVTENRKLKMEIGLLGSKVEEISDQYGQKVQTMEMNV